MTARSELNVLLGHSELLGGAILLGLDTLMLKSACRPRELPFATIPLLFAIQQLSEGVIWLTSRYEVPLFNAVMTHVYSFFSHVLWPVYVPAVGRPAHPVRLAAFLCGAGDDAFVLRASGLYRNAWRFWYDGYEREGRNWRTADVGLMEKMSGMSGKDMAMDASTQKKMSQMRKQMDQMRKNMPTTPAKK